ncbi:hypothetical protein R1flu_014591 [Riccia fluitans]|uniref:Ribosomal protein S21 n=1 Tax=Riccia fluitans TaxID=41844 RepID=A0ABD1YH90_9MARC
MAAGHTSLLSRPTKSSSDLTSFCGSLCPSFKTKCKVLSKVRLPSTRTSCRALIASPKIEKELSLIRAPHIEAPSAWNFQDFSFHERKEKDAEESVVDAARSKAKEKPKKNFSEILNGDTDDSRTDISSKLPWMDPSLRYANVMWFKGAYNAQIFVSPDDSEDSVVRRFRQAVAGAGVLKECYRRRFRETPQDVVKRKQRQAALYRKRSRQYDSNFAYAYKIPSGHSGHSKKTKNKKKESRSQPGLDAGKKGTTDKKAYDSDDDFWGYTEEPDQR